MTSYTIRSRSTAGRSARWLAACLASLLLAVTGCAKMELGDSFALWDSDPKPQTPDSVAAVWTEASLHHPGQRPVRGFGGRILFHGGDQQEAVPVEGKLTVYAYDNDRPNRDDPAPDKKFVFPADNLAAHESDSKLGPSYSFWLPWDEAGGLQRRISLLTRFEDARGKIVMSQMAHVTLAGATPMPMSNQGLAQTPPGPQRPAGGPGRLGTNGSTSWAGAGPASGEASLVQPASYDAPLSPASQAATAPAAKRASSVTIDVAPGQAARLLSATRGPAERLAAGTSRPTPAASLSTPGSPASSAGVGATEPAGAASVPTATSADSEPTQFPARTAPATRPTYAPVRRQPYHVESPHRLPPTPRSGWSQPETAPPADDASASR